MLLDDAASHAAIGSIENVGKVAVVQGFDNNYHVPLPELVPHSLNIFVDTLYSEVLQWSNTELPAEVEFSVDTVVDIVSMLLLIRLTKIIGSDRDRIIAQKIQQACDEYPGQELVVVIGMLHCNGVARYLLSGKDIPKQL